MDNEYDNQPSLIKCLVQYEMIESINWEIFRYILCLISLIFGRETTTTQLVSIYSNAAIIQVESVELKISLTSMKKISIQTYTLNLYAPNLLGSILFEIMTIVEYSFKKFSSFYKVFVIFDQNDKINQDFLCVFNCYLCRKV